MSDYEDIPLQGKHRGEGEHEAGANVRAQQPPSPAGPSARGDYVFQLLKSTEGDTYRVQVWIPGQDADVPENFAEAGRYASTGALEEALEDLPTTPCHVICEDTETSETCEVRLADLRGEWSAGVPFDRFTLFTNEDAATRYASNA